MSLIADRKKVAIFGFLGVLGCLLGWGAGEGLLASLARPDEAGAPAPTLVSKPAPLSAVSAPDKPAATPAPLLPSSATAKVPPPPVPELRERLVREGAKTGDVQISLFWEDYNDVDLHCFDPKDNHICYSKRTSPSGGELDVDMNRDGRAAGSHSSDKPVENIYWPTGKAPFGKYRVYVHGYKKHDAKNPTPFRLSIVVRGERKEYEGNVRFGSGPADGDWLHVCDFDVEPVPGAIRLGVPAEMQVLQGGQNRMQIRVARDSYEGPIQLRFRGNLSGLQSPGLTIPADQSSIEVLVKADENAEPGRRALTILATADTAKTEARMEIAIVALATDLRLSLPNPVEVRQGGEQVMQVLVARDRLRGPVELSWTGEASDLTLPPTTIPAEADSIDVPLRADMMAQLGRRSILLKAVCGTITKEAAVNLEVLPRLLPGMSLLSILIVGLWTALLAIFLTLALVVGQNLYLKRGLIQLGQAGLLVGGGLLAGLVAGGIGETSAQILRRAEVLPQLGVIAGWLLLGGLLGRGVSLFVPNLSGAPATLAGACGGLLGGMAFVALSSLQEWAGRFAGAAILGLAIGLVIALVEQLFRQAWLEIRYKSGEAMTVNLGPEPVSIGSDARACTVYARGTPAVAFRYWLKGGSITREDVATGKQTGLRPGDKQELGVVTVSVLTAGQPAQSGKPIPQPPPPPPLQLNKPIAPPPPPRPVASGPLGKPIPLPPQPLGVMKKNTKTREDESTP